MQPFANPTAQMRNLSLTIEIEPLISLEMNGIIWWMFWEKAT